jgi:hypothetical protein
MHKNHYSDLPILTQQKGWKPIANRNTVCLCATLTKQITKTVFVIIHGDITMADLSSQIVNPSWWRPIEARSGESPTYPLLVHPVFSKSDVWDWELIDLHKYLINVAWRASIEGAGCFATWARGALPHGRVVLCHMGARWRPARGDGSTQRRLARGVGSVASDEEGRYTYELATRARETDCSNSRL